MIYLISSFIITYYFLRDSRNVYASLPLTMRFLRYASTIRTLLYIYINLKKKINFIDTFKGKKKEKKSNVLNKIDKIKYILWIRFM